jgi:hypothetical protein
LFVAQVFNHPFIFWLHNENKILELGNFYLFFFPHFFLATEDIENHFFEFLISAFWRNFTSQRNSSGGRGRGREFCVFVTFACGDGAQRRKKPWASLPR